MKRQLTEQEQGAISALAEEYARLKHPDYPDQYSYERDETGDAFDAGYTACAESSVPLEEYRKVVEVLKLSSDALQDSSLDKPHFREFAARSAQEIINKAKTYLPNE